jgi:hypothetical protein
VFGEHKEDEFRVISFSAEEEDWPSNGRKIEH